MFSSIEAIIGIRIMYRNEKRPRMAYLCMHQWVRCTYVMERGRGRMSLMSESDTKCMFSSIEDVINILIMCRNEKDLWKSLRLHTYICTNGLEAHPSVGRYLISLFVELDKIWYAHQAFQRLLYVDESSWNALIYGFINHGNPIQAFSLYQKMKDNYLVHCPCGYTFVALLKACISLQDIEKGSQIHADIARIGLFEEDIFIGTTLVDMYAKFGFLEKAQDVFDSLSIQTIVSWNALICGCVEHGRSEEALQLFEKMQESGISADAITLVCTLKACRSNIEAFIRGQRIHAEITRKGFLEGNIFISTALIDMYAKCGNSLKEAQYVFNKIPIQNEVSWTALIAGYTDHGYGNEALHYFKMMQNGGFSPHISTFISIMKACSCIGSSVDGQEIHAEITKRGIAGGILVDNSLIDMYSKCGLLTEAKYVFDKLPSPTVVSWTVLISGYSEHGFDQGVMECLQKMQQEGITLDSTAFVCCLKACTNLQMLVVGQTLHTEIVGRGLSETDSITSLVQMYARSGLLIEARALFDNFRDQTVILWNVMIAGYVESAHASEALACFAVMQYQGFLPDDITFLYILNVCSSIQHKIKGQELHTDIFKRGLDRELVIGNALVSMYAGCGSLLEAIGILEKLPMKTAVSWTALIAAQVECGYCEDALHSYDQIRYETNLLNSAIWICSLKACTTIAAIDKSREIHCDIIKRGIPANDPSIRSTLVASYVKQGLLVDAHKLLDGVIAQDHVSWTAIIKGYMDNGCYEDAIECFRHMKREGIPIDAITFVCSLSACGSICTSGAGLKMHSDIIKMGFESELVVGNSLVDMYAKCGLPIEATQAFNQLVFKDVVSWNAVITCYSQLGDCVNAFVTFENMIREAVHPDSFTYFSVLNVCSHSGLPEDGYMFFTSINSNHILNPTPEHYTCIVDLLLRAERINEAIRVIENMPKHPCLPMWHATLGACEKSGNVALGREAFKHTVELNDTDSTAYVAMSNTFAVG